MDFVTYLKKMIEEYENKKDDDLPDDIKDLVKTGQEDNLKKEQDSDNSAG